MSTIAQDPKHSMEYDAEAQIKIGEYEYVKVCKSVESLEEAADMGRALQIAWHGSTGIPDTDFNAFLDTYLTTNTGELEVFNRMNKEQQAIIQAIKRSRKRIAYKNGKQE